METVRIKVNSFSWSLKEYFNSTVHCWTSLDQFIS